MQISDSQWEKALKLNSVLCLWTIGKEEAEKHFNGIGADWMSDDLRGVITAYWEEFAPAAIVHDLEFDMVTNRSLASFFRCNRRFSENCQQLAEIAWAGKANKKARKLRVAEAKAFRAILNATALKAWREAGRKTDA